MIYSSITKQLSLCLRITEALIEAKAVFHYKSHKNYGIFIIHNAKKQSHTKKPNKANKHTTQSLNATTLKQHNTAKSPKSTL